MSGFSTEHSFIEIRGCASTLGTASLSQWLMQRPWQSWLFILLTADILGSGRGEAQKGRFLRGGRSRSSSFCIPENRCCKAEEEIATALKCLIWEKKSWGRKMRAGWPWSHRMEELCAPTCAHSRAQTSWPLLYFSVFLPKTMTIRRIKISTHVWVWASYWITTLLHTFLQMLYTVS